MVLSILRLLSFIASVLLLANKVHSQKGRIISQNYNFPPNSTDLIYQGDAHVLPTKLRLTKTDASGNPVSWSVGRVVYSRPVKFWEPGRQLDFFVILRFVITPSKNGAADGIAFFIAPVDTTIPSGSSGHNLGIFNSSGTASSLFAVEFDTFVNTWDPNYRHIGIDINSRVSKNVTRFDSATGQVVTARIKYEARTRTISVVADSAGSQLATLTYVFNLKTILPQWVQLGVSASTGQYVSELGVHDLFSWWFFCTLECDCTDENEEKYIQQYVSV